MGCGLWGRTELDTTEATAAAAAAAVLTVQILWQRTGEAVKWDLLTTREMFFFFLVSSQVEHLVRLKELAARGNNLNLLSYVKRQTAQS